MPRTNKRDLADRVYETLYQNGAMTAEAIAALVGCHPKTVQSTIYQLDIIKDPGSYPVVYRLNRNSETLALWPAPSEDGKALYDEIRKQHWEENEEGRDSEEVSCEESREGEPSCTVEVFADQGGKGVG